MEKLIKAFKGESTKGITVYLFYEFVGTMVISWAYDIAGRNCLSIVPLIVYITCWDRSAAHFNWAVTLGDAVFSSDSL